MSKYLNYKVNEEIKKYELNSNTLTKLKIMLDKFYLEQEDRIIRIGNNKDESSTVNKIIALVVLDEISSYLIPKELREWKNEATTEILSINTNDISHDKYIFLNNCTNKIITMADLIKTKYSLLNYDPKRLLDMTEEKEIMIHNQAGKYDGIEKMIIKKNDIRDLETKKEITKKLFIRAITETKLGQYIKEIDIDNALSSIVFYDSLSDFYEKCRLVNLEEHPSFANYSIENQKKNVENISGFYRVADKKIYINSETKITELVHEIIHKLSYKGKGVKLQIINLIEQKSLMFDNFNADDITIINEGFTEYLANLIVPEVETSSAYYYIKRFIENYYLIVSTNSINEDLLYQAYFNGNEFGISIFTSDIFLYSNFDRHLLKDIASIGYKVAMDEIEITSDELKQVNQRKNNMFQHLKCKYNLKENDKYM